MKKILVEVEIPEYNVKYCNDTWHGSRCPFLQTYNFGFKHYCVLSGKNITKIKSGGDRICRPSYVPDGCCQWCGKKIEGNRKKSFCSSDCSKRYNYFVTWNRGRGSYSTHILRRDNFTCQDCGEIHRTVNELGIEIPVSDGNLELHHIQFVCNGGDDSPDNLVTLCHKCHVERHIKVKEE